MIDTYVKVIHCPECGAAVREVVSHSLFQVEGTSIGPPDIACPRCGLLVESGLSEWDQKSFLARYFYFLRLVLWAIVGSIVLAAGLGLGGVWLLVELRWISFSTAGVLRWVIVSLTPVMVFWVLFRNAFREIRVSQERTRRIETTAERAPD